MSPLSAGGISLPRHKRHCGPVVPSGKDDGREGGRPTFGDRTGVLDSREQTGRKHHSITENLIKLILGNVILCIKPITGSNGFVCLLCFQNTLSE